MINRAAVLVRLRAPFVDWINQADQADKRPQITLQEANEDRTIYLIEEDEADCLEEWIALNFEQIFTYELEDWQTDMEKWPQKRTREMFDAWCEIECHTVIVDTVGGDIIDDEA